VVVGNAEILLLSQYLDLNIQKTDHTPPNLPRTQKSGGIPPPRPYRHDKITNLSSWDIPEALLYPAGFPVND